MAIIKVIPQSVDICPECGKTSITTYDTRDYGYRLKRKKCLDCGYRYPTLEILVDDWKKYTEADDIYVLGFEEGQRQAEEFCGKAIDRLIKRVEELIKNGK